MPLPANFLKAIGILGGVREAKKILHSEREAQKGIAPVASPPSGPTTAKPASVPGTETGHDTDLSEVHGPFGYAKELYTRFNTDLCPAWAASLSFFSILSIVPVLLCGLAVLGFLIQSPEEAARKVQDMVTKMLPGSAATEAAQKLIQDAHIEQTARKLMDARGTSGIIGIVSLFWSSLQIFLNAVVPMNAAFRAKETRGFIKLRFVALGLLLGAGLLFMVSLLPTITVQYLAKDYLSKSSASIALAVAGTLISITVNATMFTVIYRYLPSPSARVTWREAGFAGAVVALLSEIAKRGFAFYLTHFGAKGYNKLYGGLGGLIMVIFWIYYSSMILLLGAEIAKLYADAQEAKKAKIAAA